MSKRVSNVAYQVMWNRLISVVEEQAQALIRTAFSTSVREAGDLSAGVYDIRGQMLAQAVTGTPGHVNAMAESVGHFIRRIGYDDMFEGDVYVTNDPWEGTGHLHDITVVTPSFYRGSLVGFSRLHRTCGRYWRTRIWSGRQFRIRRGAAYPDHEVCG